VLATLYLLTLSERVQKVVLFNTTCDSCVDAVDFALPLDHTRRTTGNMQFSSQPLQSNATATFNGHAKHMDSPVGPPKTIGSSTMAENHEHTNYDKILSGTIKLTYSLTPFELTAY